MDPILGEIKLWAGTWAPQGWQFCQGQALSIQTYAALYSLIGTTYGGDGRTTFNLPDLRGRVPVASGKNPNVQNGQYYTLGTYGGLEAVTLSAIQMPMHNHTGSVTTTTQLNFTVTPPAVANPTTTTVSPAGNYITAPTAQTNSGGEQVDVSAFSPGPQNASMAPFAVSTTLPPYTLQTTTAGNSQPHENRQPYQVLNYIIAGEGPYPPRPD